MQKKNLIMTVALLMISAFSFAQKGNVGINTEHPRATLEVVGDPAEINHYDGIIPPRITGDQLNAKTFPADCEGAIVFVTEAVTATTTTQTTDITTAGYYYFNGAQWVHFANSTILEDNKVNWFYMPSINISTEVVTPASDPYIELDLYKAYKDQFTVTETKYRSAGAPADIPYLPDAADIMYYITDIDATVLDINDITADGKMHYKVLKAASPYTFINIVFVIK